MEEVKLIRNEMKDRVQKLIAQKDTSDEKQIWQNYATA